VPVANRAQRQVTTARWWDSTQRRDFKHYCGALMDDLYPEWRRDLVVSPWQRICNDALSYLSPRRATGRILRRVARPLPPQMRRTLRRALSGRGVLQYDEAPNVVDNVRSGRA
jgi:hypothetical protein